MTRVWVADCPGHVAALAGGESSSFRVISPLDVPAGAADAEILVVYANAVEGARAQRLGMGWLQRFRRQTLSLAPALVYSFEARQTLAAHFTMLGPGTPGIDFLRLPFLPSDLRERLDGAAALTAGELRGLLRWHGGLQGEWRTLAHVLAGSLKNWPERPERARLTLEELSQSVRVHAPDQLPALERLLDIFARESSTPYEVRESIELLEKGLCQPAGRNPARAGEDTPPPAPYDRPPRGYVTIAVADDAGYERSTMNRLRGLGYDVSNPALNLSEAENLLHYWCPNVILTDLHFPTREEGRQLISLALASECLVIAISRSVVMDGELPPGVEDCCGALRYQDAERIHRLIWRRALSERGVGNV